MCRCEDNLEDTVFEPEYEKVEKTVYNTVITVKTAADVMLRLLQQKLPRSQRRKRRRTMLQIKLRGAGWSPPLRQT
jgi:hypothetical protein